MLTEGLAVPVFEPGGAPVPAVEVALPVGVARIPVVRFSYELMMDWAAGFATKALAIDWMTLLVTRSVGTAVTVSSEDTNDRTAGSAAIEEYRGCRPLAVTNTGMMEARPVSPGINSPTREAISLASWAKEVEAAASRITDSVRRIVAGVR